jgi:hypothetical protein
MMRGSSSDERTSLPSALTMMSPDSPRPPSPPGLSSLTPLTERAARSAEAERFGFLLADRLDLQRRCVPRVTRSLFP